MRKSVIAAHMVSMVGIVFCMLQFWSAGTGQIVDWWIARYNQEVWK